MFSVTVPVYVKKGDDKRNYVKVDWCLYCEGKITSRISKHNISMHSERSLVKEIERCKADLNKKKKEKLMYKLQQLGNYKHNVKVNFIFQFIHFKTYFLSRIALSSLSHLRIFVTFKLLNATNQFSSFYSHPYV